MTVAIKTTYHGPTTHRGSRVSAVVMAKHPTTGKRERLEMAYDGPDTHDRAVAELARRLGWYGEWVAGDAGGSSYVYVRVLTDRVQVSKHVASPRVSIYGSVIVGGVTYDDDNIAMLVGKGLGAWRWGGDQGDEEANICVEVAGVSKSFGNDNGGLPAALAYIAEVEGSI